MSDEEYEYDYGSDAEYDYGSDQGSGDGMADEAIEIENSYYEADDYRTENPAKAIELFERVIELETAQGDEVKWRFKALQHLVTIYYSLHEYSKMVDRYKLMLDYSTKVTRNECTDAINSVLDTITGATTAAILSQMYEITLDTMKTSKNERLWFNTNLKLAKVYLDEEKYNEVDRIISMLKSTCQRPDGTDDPSKGNYLLEVYSLEIQLCTATRNTVRMKKVYPLTLHMNAAVSDPRIMGGIREEGGKMYMSQGHWMDAYNEFYEAFRAYQEAGNGRAKSCLKYVVLASMLSLSDINPFAAREAKVYAEDPEIVAMSDLRQCLESNDFKRFERTLHNKKNRIVDEPLLMVYIEPLRRRMREQVLINLTKPYRKVTLKYLASELSLSVADVERLLVDMILDKRLMGCVNQVEGYLEMEDSHQSASSKKMDAIARYADCLEKSAHGILNIGSH